MRRLIPWTATGVWLLWGLVWTITDGWTVLVTCLYVPLLATNVVLSYRNARLQRERLEANWLHYGLALATTEHGCHSCHDCADGDGTAALFYRPNLGEFWLCAKHSNMLPDWEHWRIKAARIDEV